MHRILLPFNLHLDCLFQVIAIARGGDNILLPQYAEAVKRLSNYVMYKLYVKYAGKSWYYEDLCLKWGDECQSNKQVDLVSSMLNGGANVSFPSFQVGSYRI